VSKIKKVSKEELELLSHKDCVRFALFCAEQVKDGWKDISECVSAIETAERWLEGKASAEECRVAAYAAHDAAYAAADAAYYTAYYATYAAYYAAYYAANATNANYATNAAHATYAAHTAAYATSDAADYAAHGKPHLIDAQRNYYEELLYFDDIAEKLLLGEIV